MNMRTLKLYTPDVMRQYAFYKQFGAKVTHLSEEAFQMELPQGKIIWIQREGATPYHLAFHIASGQEEAALKWLKSEMHLSILEHHGKEIVDFPAWKARSIYFYDGDHNLVELISRDLWPSVPGVFSGSDLLGVAEIGVATTEVAQAVAQLKKTAGLEMESGDGQVFCAVGDHKGFFIVIDKGRKRWMPVEDIAHASPFEVVVEHNDLSIKLVYQNDTIIAL